MNVAASNLISDWAGAKLKDWLEKRGPAYAFYFFNCSFDALCIAEYLVLFLITDFFGAVREDYAKEKVPLSSFGCGAAVAVGFESKFGANI